MSINWGLKNQSPKYPCQNLEVYRICLRHLTPTLFNDWEVHIQCRVSEAPPLNVFGPHGANFNVSFLLTWLGWLLHCLPSRRPWRLVDDKTTHRYDTCRKWNVYVWGNASAARIFFSSFLRDRIFVSIKDELISVLHRSYVHRNAKVVKCTTYVPICHNNQVFGRVTLDRGYLVGSY